MYDAKTLTIAFLALAQLSLAGCGTTHKDKAPPQLPGEETKAGPAQAEAGSKKPGMIGKLAGKKDTPNPGPCPLLGVLYDASRVVELKQPEEKFANVGFTGEINNVRGLCTYSGALPIEMSMDIDMAFGRGPMAGGDTHVYRYWVAVTRTDIAPLAKEYFDVPVKFQNGDARLFHTETIKKIVIPRANANVSGAAFEILVGFDLTPDQLAFNRAGKRFKMNAGENPG
jgi:hypothetical protein